MGIMSTDAVIGMTASPDMISHINLVANNDGICCHDLCCHDLV